MVLIDSNDIAAKDFSLLVVNGLTDVIPTSFPQYERIRQSREKVLSNQIILKDFLQVCSSMVTPDILCCRSNEEFLLIFMNILVKLLRSTTRVFTERLDHCHRIGSLLDRTYRLKTYMNRRCHHDISYKTGSVFSQITMGDRDTRVLNNAINTVLSLALQRFELVYDDIRTGFDSASGYR